MRRIISNKVCGNQDTASYTLHLVCSVRTPSTRELQGLRSFSIHQQFNYVPPEGFTRAEKHHVAVTSTGNNWRSPHTLIFSFIHSLTNTDDTQVRTVTKIINI